VRAVQEFGNVLDYFGKDENVGKCEKCNHDLRLGSLTISQSLSQALPIYLPFGCSRNIRHCSNSKKVGYSF
jgi:hypothetical protein